MIILPFKLSALDRVKLETRNAIECGSYVEPKKRIKWSEVKLPDGVRF